MTHYAPRSEASPLLLNSNCEIFGPVLSIIPFAEDEEAIAIANDTVYGL